MKLICSNVVNHKIFSPGFIQSIPDIDVPFLVTGTGMTNSNPIFGNGNGNENSIKFHSHFREREWEWKIPFPTFGTGIGGRYSREFPGIPGNSRDREFPGYCYCKFATSRLGIGILQIFGLVTHCLGKGGCLKWCQNTGIAKSSFPPSPLPVFWHHSLHPPFPYHVIFCIVQMPTNAMNFTDLSQYYIEK